MFIRLFFFLASFSPTIEEWLWKRWYQRLASAYKKEDWRFMNYGYAAVEEKPPVVLSNQIDEENRLFIQLYQYALTGLDIKGKKLLEVGSGRGGGADYVARYLDPSSIIGVDFAKNAIDLCNQFYHLPNLSFKEGNAEKLPFDDDQFDLVFNIESSHCYGNMPAFIAEVTRVLKPGGIFVWADLRQAKDMEKDHQIFINSSLKLIFNQNITPNILRALDLISDRKKEAIEQRVSSFWRSLFFEFSGIRNSKIYRSFADGKMVYWYYRFEKPY